ncbi:hypothetical protein [Sphingomonas abietis]|uniref:Uncharacterized protein n=1 Tax=Sphingomonas abietis TaxID=3012344 RepID=A0ABY7NQN5_9SPHN|nr:hypothetical protein [Sphingomonas abietis]WBO22867.1 hypothetical protein PBT88_01590 [Sphingomonas abietis]
MVTHASMPTRRALLGALTATPVATLAVTPIRSPWLDTLAPLYEAYDDVPVSLVRTRAGRRLSLARYRTARVFFPRDPFPTSGGWHDFLYYAGITAQLGLSAHLLDVGFPDAWCARHIGLRVAKSLAYANATGFGHDCPDMSRLASVLTPYWIWNRPVLLGDPSPDDGGFAHERVAALLHALLNHVGAVTGHQDCSRRQRKEPRDA